MNGKPITSEEIEKIVRMRQTGHSLPEIRKALKRGNGTIFRHIQGVEILPSYRTAWEIKRGGNKRRAEERWQEAESNINNLLSEHFKKEDFLIIASCLYWGEGTKREFGFINSDPEMVQVLIYCLEKLGVNKERLRISLRIYEDIKPHEARNFWAGIIGIPPESILSINVLSGKKTGKLKYGMCRIRITKGQDVFKMLQAAIKKIRVVTIGSPRSSNG